MKRILDIITEKMQQAFVDAGYDDTNVAKYAILQPAVDIDNLEQVFILTDFTME